MSVMNDEDPTTPPLEARMTRQTDVERLARRMYDETFDRIEDPDLRGVAKDRVTVLFGPPMLRPDVALVSFQGGAGDKTPSPRTWPERLVYLDDKFKFGQALRAQFQAAGLRETLETRTVAMAACFPEAPVSEAGRWCAKRGPRARWREFSSSWVRRMLRAMRPRAVIVFGTRASQALGLDEAWREVARRDSNNHMDYGRAEIEGCPAVFCHHSSQGYSACWVQKCLGEVRGIIDTNPV